MRLRTSLGLAAIVSAGLTQTSSAVVRPKGAEAPIVSATRGPRAHRAVTWAKPHGALAGWSAIYDHDTNVPLRMWGQGQLVAGAVANAATAEAAARSFLAQHLATLAPGAAVGDFELVANALSPSGEVRSVGFAQRASGVRVLGGSIGFSFKHDRLIMVSSTALPNISVAVPTTHLPAAVLANKATQWLADAGHAVRVGLASSRLGFAPSERVIVPIVRPRRGATPDISYRVAEQLVVEATTSEGRWNVWVDAADASPIARSTTIRYASGTVLFDVPDRHPAGTRTGKAAAFATHVVDGTATTATADGTITWAGNAAGNVQLTLAGPFVTIANQSGPVLTETQALAPGGTLTWSKANEEMADAQLDAFVYANTVKQFTKARINPTLAWLDESLTVVVNETQTCNAYSTGDDIHFFRKGSQCENTGRMADVVYHEFGHSLHAHSIIDGVGAFDGALSEGMSDALAMLITRDHGMGRGFFFTDAPLRDLQNTKRWPDDVTGEVHDDGEIIGGVMYDLGVALEGKLGATAGYAKTIELYYGVLQRASDIPSAYAEALVTDDDDGDVSNGTPNQCEINAAFGAHGLADPSITLGLGTPVRDGYAVSLAVSPASASACPGPTVDTAVIDWKPRGGAGGQIALTRSGDAFAGNIPNQPDGTVVQYKITVTLSDGATVSYPKNDADPFYEFYVGTVTKLWCADFEAGLGDWTHGASPANRDEWEAGEPLGLGGDPKAAYGGTGVLGIDLSNDGVYRTRMTTFAESPEIDLAGNPNVRLQYQRWLGVEDGFFDRAKILANGIEVWNNYASQTDPQTGGVSHIDREWRFQDVDLTAQAATGKLKLRFELQSDEGFELGGWTMDDVCIVAISGPAVTCGNSTVDDAETCDDGNRSDGDGCDANCQTEPSSSDDAGCCSVGGGPEGAIALSLLTFGALFVRRRRRA